MRRFFRGWWLGLFVLLVVGGIPWWFIARRGGEEPAASKEEAPGAPVKTAPLRRGIS